MPEVKLDLKWHNLNKAFDELEKECENIVRGMTVEFWNRVLERTPQFYGRAVASYNYSINTLVFVDRSGAVQSLMSMPMAGSVPWGPSEGVEQVEVVRSRGDPVAIGIATNANAGRDRRFKLGDTVYITNGVEHGEGSYSEGLENGAIKLRSENRPGAMVKRTVDYMSFRYANRVTPARAAQLKSLTLGGSD